MLLPIFTTILLPIVLVAGSGLLLARTLDLDSRSIGRVVFYLFTPALVFRSLYQIDLAYAVVGRTALVAAIVAATTGGLAWMLSTQRSRRERAAMVLTSSLSNNGNMGLPVSLFAFGEQGLALATIYYVTTTFLGNTVGVVVASSGRANLRQALRRSVRVPLLYAATAGLIVGVVDLPIPVGIFRAIDIMAEAAVPTMLVLLGLQLSTAPIVGRSQVLGITLGLRLLVAPTIALLVSMLLAISGLERNVVILQAAMPTAVMTAVLATEFDTAPRFVATAIAAGTALSLVTISVVLWLIQ